jgi:hypothetical protein
VVNNPKKRVDWRWSGKEHHFFCWWDSYRTSQPFRHVTSTPKCFIFGVIIAVMKVLGTSWTSVFKPEWSCRFFQRGCWCLNSKTGVEDDDTRSKIGLQRVNALRECCLFGRTWINWTYRQLKGVTCVNVFHHHYHRHLRLLLRRCCLIRVSASCATVIIFFLLRQAAWHFG